MININDTLPEMALEAYQQEQIKKINLADFRGHWLVMVFYPADFTFVCPTELGELAQRYEAFKAEGAEIISVSTDTVFVHKAWHDASPIIKNISFPMVADPTAKLARLMNVYLEDLSLIHISEPTRPY